MAEEKTTTYVVPQIDFWDPNWRPDKEGELDLTYNPEDLSIYVSLKVKPNRKQFITNLDGNNGGIQVNWTVLSEDGGEVNILGGKKYGDQSVLTDFYEDISLNSDKIYNGGDKEALGLRSINIQYNSMFLPEVNIEFVDIRGMSLAAPSQAFKEKKTGTMSFFSAFYTFPYPMFVLTVKGIYGNPVVYELHCLDVRTTIDTATGNVIISAKFLGYSFAQLSDIPFPWVACLPDILYGQGVGREIWSDISRKGLNGTYKNTPIPTIYELYRKTYSAVSETEKMAQNSDVGNNNTNLNDLKNSITNLQNAVVGISSLFCDRLKVESVNNGIIIGVTKETKNSVNEKINAIITEEKYIGLVDDFNIYTKAVDDGCEKLGKPKINTDIGLVKDNKLVNPFGDKDTSLVFDYNKLISECTRQLEETNNDIESAKQKLLQEQRNTVITTLGFIPTIGNIIRILFAHYEMFHRIFFLLRDNVGARKFGEFMIEGNAPNTDIFSKSNVTELPAWFGLRTTKENGRVSIWPGSQYAERNYFKPGQVNNLEEVKFIKAFAQCLRDFQKGLDEPPLPPGGNYVLDPDTVWQAINPYDISYDISETHLHRINPYKELLEKLKAEELTIKDKLRVIGKEIGVRMFYGVSTRRYTKHFKEGEDNGVNIVAEAEANNFYNAVKDDIDLIERLKNYISKDNLLINGFMFLWNSNIKPGETGFLDENSAIELPEIGKTELCCYSREAEMVVKSEQENSKSAFYKYCFAVSKPLKENYFQYSWEFPRLPMVSLSLKEMEKYSFETRYIPYITTSSNTIRFGTVAQKSLISFQEYNDKIQLLKAQINNSFLTNTWYIERNSTIFSEFFMSRQMSIKDDFDKSFDYPSEKDINLSLRNNAIKFTDGGNRTFISKDFLRRGQNTNNIDRLNLFMGKYKYGDNTPYTLQYLGFSGDKTFIPVYGFSKYYDIDTDVTKRAKKLSRQDDMVSKYKAVILLSTLGINITTVLTYVNNALGLNNGILRLPKCVVLCLGACQFLWDEKFLLEHGWGEAPFYSEMAKLFPPFGTIYQGYTLTAFKEYFVAWVKSDAIKIIDKLELKHLGFEIYSAKAYKSLFNNSEDTLGNILTMFTGNKDGILETYWGASYATMDIDDGLFLFLDPNSWAAQEIMKLYTTDILISSSHCAAFQSDDTPIQLEMVIEDITDYLVTFVSTLGGLLNIEKNEVDVDTPNSLMTHEEEILGIHYYSFKKYNDYWFDGKGIPGNERSNYELEKWYDQNNSSCTIHLIDKFYYDISDSLICNLDIIQDIISIAMGETLDTTFDSFYAVLSNMFSKHKMLLIPTPSNIKNWKIDGLKEIFTPVPFTDINWDEVTGGMSIIGIYIGEPATGPTLYEDDEADRTYDIMMVKSSMDNQYIPAPLDNTHQSNIVIPVFAVTYGKQNQQYFQVASLSNTNPQVTDQSIRAQVRIAERANGDSNTDVASGQDLYDIYSAHAYQATIEMPGCVQIQPMMYFQLNNVYLFTGSYMIFKIEHDIEPGKMTTKFTGIKQTWTRTPLLTEPYMMTSIINDDGAGYVPGIPGRYPITPGPGCVGGKPLGLCNNNPLNIRVGTADYDGKIPGGNKGFETFKSIEYGYRAAFVLLSTYYTKHNRDTIQKILYRWAPPADKNDTAQYVTNVAAWTGIPYNEPLTLSDGYKYIKIVAAMSYQENGQAADFNNVIAGFKIQQRISIRDDDKDKLKDISLNKA
jgi:hypothetical protein